MSTKYFDLFSALKAGGDKGVAPAALAKSLNFSAGSLAVYIHALRNKFGANIESVRAGGRVVVAYRLLNVAECEKNISPNRKSRTTKSAKSAAKPQPRKGILRNVSKTVTKSVTNKKATAIAEDGSVPVLDDLTITEYTDNDLSDIKHQLGIG